MTNKHEISAKKLFNNFKECKELDFTKVYQYDQCIKQGQLFKKALSPSYSLYSESIKATNNALERLTLEKQYKMILAKSSKVKQEGSAVELSFQLQYLRDSEVRSWNNLEKLVKATEDPNLVIEDSRDLSTFPFGSVITVIVFLYVVYLINSLLSGKIFKLKVISQLELLEQDDLVDLLKRDIQIKENTFSWTDRKILKRQNTEDFLDSHEKMIVKRIYENQSLVNDAYRKYMTPVSEDISEEELGKIHEEIRIILREFYFKIGINLDQNDENLPFNDDESIGNDEE